MALTALQRTDLAWTTVARQRGQVRTDGAPVG